MREQTKYSFTLLAYNYCMLVSKKRQYKGTKTTKPTMHRIILDDFHIYTCCLHFLSIDFCY